MLKGNSKGIMGENMREFKKRGLSEKDAVMASMKRSKKESKAQTLGPEPSSHENYPYSTRLDLDSEMMEKLGMKKLKHGQKVRVHAKGHVHSMSEDTGSDGKTTRRATIQMTHMKVDHNSDEAEE